MFRVQLSTGQAASKVLLFISNGMQADLPSHSVVVAFFLIIVIANMSAFKSDQPSLLTLYIHPLHFLLIFLTDNNLFNSEMIYLTCWPLNKTGSSSLLPCQITYVKILNCIMYSIVSVNIAPTRPVL